MPNSLYRKTNRQAEIFEGETLEANSFLRIKLRSWRFIPPVRNVKAIGFRDKGCPLSIVAVLVACR